MTTFRLKVRQQGQLARLRGIEVESVEPATTVSLVPGSPLGMALVRGQIVPVLRLGELDGSLIVGRVAGEVLGIVGLDIVGLELEDVAVEESSPMAGFDVSADWRTLSSDSYDQGDVARELDIEACIAKIKLHQRHPAQSPEEIA